MYEHIINQLRQSYNRMVEERDKKEIAPWKVEERQQFLSRLQAENKRSLLDIGAGTGVHGKFFQDNGLQVICADLSPEMVKRCRQKGLTAYVMDFLNLDFPPDYFEAIFAMNCLLHVPREELPGVLKVLQQLLKPGGLFYWGQYGGVNRAEIWPEDNYEPQRFFSFLSDEVIQEVTTGIFEIHTFKTIPIEKEFATHFQSMILRRKESE